MIRYLPVSKCDKLTHNIFSEKSCKEEKDCSAVDAKMCSMQKFKEELEKKCRRKCAITDCLDSTECQKLNITKDLCNILHEKCPNTCEKYDY